jgi:hypothetical protein
MTTSRDMTIEEFCDKHKACQEGREWARTHCTTMQECWEKLTDPVWIAWVASRPGVLTNWEQWEFALFCCELVKTHLTDFRSFAAISILRLWLAGEVGVGLQELKLASWGAAAAWDDAAAAEEEEDLAAATVAAAVNVDEDADSAGVPIIVHVVDYAYRAGADPARLANWLRTFTKPNFTKKAGPDA